MINTIECIHWFCGQSLEVMNYWQQKYLKETGVEYIDMMSNDLSAFYKWLRKQDIYSKTPVK